jgi:hypothetical protein
MLMAAPLLVGILALPAASGAQASVASNASLEETLSWLKSTLPNVTGASFGGYTLTIFLESANGCDITLKTGVVSEYYSHPFSEHRTFSLSDIEPSAVGVRKSTKTGPYSVFYGTRGRKRMIRYVNSLDPSNEMWSQGDSVAYFPNIADAKRVAKALKHAVQLCANAQPL